MMKLQKLPRANQQDQEHTPTVLPNRGILWLALELGYKTEQDHLQDCRKASTDKHNGLLKSEAKNVLKRDMHIALVSDLTEEKAIDENEMNVDSIEDQTATVDSQDEGTGEEVTGEEVEQMELARAEFNPRARTNQRILLPLNWKVVTMLETALEETDTPGDNSPSDVAVPTKHTAAETVILMLTRRNMTVDVMPIESTSESYSSKISLLTMRQLFQWHTRGNRNCD